MGSSVVEGALSPTLVNNKVVWGGGARGVVPESWGPTRYRRRGRYGFAHPLPFEDKAGARVFVICFDDHHSFLPINSRGWFDWVRSRSS